MDNLESLIYEFGQIDEEFKDLKSRYDSAKEQLKDLFGECNLTKESYGGYTITRVVSERENFNEAKALDILKRNWVKSHPNDICPFAKTVEVLDMEALESAMYNKEIEDDVIMELDTCRKVTQVVTLKCTKSKKKED